MYKTTFLGVLEAEKLQKHKCTLFSETPCSKSQTSLSNHIHKLESENMQYEINWSIIDKGKSFAPVTNVYTLCNKEKYHILFNPRLADLNSTRPIPARSKIK